MQSSNQNSLTFDFGWFSMWKISLTEIKSRQILRFTSKSQIYTTRYVSVSQTKVQGTKELAGVSNIVVFLRGYIIKFLKSNIIFCDLNNSNLNSNLILKMKYFEIFKNRIKKNIMINLMVFLRNSDMNRSI